MILKEDIFFAARDLWTDDDNTSFSGNLSALTEEEAFFYRSLAEGAYGACRRLDLERIPLPVILQALGVKTSEEEAASEFASLKEQE